MKCKITALSAKFLPVFYQLRLIYSWNVFILMQNKTKVSLGGKFNLKITIRWHRRIYGSIFINHHQENQINITH